MERTRWNDDLETWCDERYYRKDEVDEMISQLELNSGLVFSVEVDSEIFSVDDGVQEFRANLSWSNGTGVDGKNVLFSLVDGNNNVLDTSLVTTDVDGYAVYEYTPTGRGQVFVTASYGTLLQETFVLYDCIYYDLATSDTTNKYSKKNCNVTFDNDKLTMVRTENGECYMQYMTGASNPVSQYTGKTIRFECDIVEATANCHIRIYQQVNGVFTNVYSPNTTSGHLIVESSIDSDATSVLFRINGNSLGTGGTCSFKNITIYPV